MKIFHQNLIKENLIQKLKITIIIKKKIFKIKKKTIQMSIQQKNLKKRKLDFSNNKLNKKLFHFQLFIDFKQII